MAYSYEQELDALKNAQKRAAAADLSNTRNQTLSNLQNESMKNTANFAAQRNVANVQNRIGNKNFQEYLASTGRANTGLAAQARLQSRNNLNTQLNNINSAENAARADINRRITNANNAYDSGLTAANANIEANYINNLLDQRYKAQQQANDERDFNERVRQFNAQLYSNFNSGGGGFDDTTSGDQINWTDNNVITPAAVNNNTSNNTIHTGFGYGPNSNTTNKLSSQSVKKVTNSAVNLGKAIINAELNAGKLLVNPLGTITSSLLKNAKKR